MSVLTTWLYLAEVREDTKDSPFRGWLALPNGIAAVATAAPNQKYMELAEVVLRYNAINGLATIIKDRHGQAGTIIPALSGSHILGREVDFQVDPLADAPMFRTPANRRMDQDLIDLDAGGGRKYRLEKIDKLDHRDAQEEFANMMVQYDGWEIVGFSSDNNGVLRFILKRKG
jgi:hypothetical protein